MPLALAVARLGVARLLRSLCLGRDAPGYEYVQLSSCGPLPFSPPQGEQLAWCEVFVERHRLDVRRWGNSCGGATMPASAPVRVRSIVVHLHEIGVEQSLDANPGIGEIVEISDVDRVNGNAVASHHNARYEPSGSGATSTRSTTSPSRRSKTRGLCSCLEAPYDRARLTSRRALLEPRPAC